MGTPVHARVKVWVKNYEQFVDGERSIGYLELKRRQTMLESALYHADPVLKEMMVECAAELAKASEALIQSGHAVVFAPFHICSDAIATITAAMVPPYRSHAYSIYSREHFAHDEAAHLQAFNAELTHHHPNSPPSHQRIMFRDIRAGLANVVIFPDILPQFTMSLLGRLMRTRKVMLFGREARLHSGAEEIARMAGGKLLPFYIYWKNNRLEIRIFEPCDDTHDIARCIEQALQECGDQWLLWHFPSLFYFNDGSQV